MGSCTSNEQESNASSTRLQSGPSGRGLNEDLDRVERETEKERTEEERVANSQPIAITATDPPPGVTVEIGEAATVLAFLKKVALLLGLDESDAPSLQMLFSEAILAHELELKAAGLCDESLCSVLGVEERLEAKAEAKAKAVNIITAVKKNRLADVQLVCQHAPEKLNDKDERGDSALHKAAYNNSLAVAELLVQAKADVHAKGTGGFSALHWTADKNSLPIAELLVQAKADVTAKTNSGYSVLHMAAAKNSLEIVELLVQAKADLYANDKSGHSALHKAAYSNLLEVAELLVEAKSDVDAKNKDGESALHNAAEKNSLEVAELLVQAKADVQAKDMYGFSALHKAAEKNSLAVAKLLVQTKADVTAKTNKGESALDWAAQGNQEMITILSQ